MRPIDVTELRPNDEILFRSTTTSETMYRNAWSDVKEYRTTVHHLEPMGNDIVVRIGDGREGLTQGEDGHDHHDYKYSFKSEFFLINRPVKVPELYSSITSPEEFDALPVGSMIKATGFYHDYAFVLEKGANGWLAQKNQNYYSPENLIKGYKELVVIHNPEA
jgi:hypothetical protein